MNSKRKGIILDGGDNNVIYRNIIKKNIENGLFLRDSNFNIITGNTFLDNNDPDLKDILAPLYDNRGGDAYFLRSFDNNWNGNYWNRGRLIPKIITGGQGIDGQTLCFNFDWTPLRKPIGS